MAASGLVGDYGVGATVSFSSTTLTMCIESIELPETTLGRQEVQCISNTTGLKQYVVEELAEISDVTINVIWETVHAAIPLGNVETMTITFPLRSGPSGTEATAATLVGSGYISSVKYPNLSTSEIQKGSIKFSFDNGATPLTYTPAT